MTVQLYLLFALLQVSRELSFWHIPEAALDDCCWLRLDQERALRARRTALMDLVTAAREKQEETLDKLKDMPPADNNNKITKKVESLFYHY